MSEILLYYAYASLQADGDEIERFYRESCGRLELRGRVRIALDGTSSSRHLQVVSCNFYSPS